VEKRKIGRNARSSSLTGVSCLLRDEHDITFTP